MATEVNQNYFAWSQEESSAQDISQGTPQLFGHGSISFGRFDLESLEWEKWSVFTNDKRHEEFGKFNGLVAKKKAYFEEYFRKVRELKALQQQNQQTELNLDYSGDGSDSSQTGEDEQASDHLAPTGSGTPVDDSREQKIATTTFKHEVECHDDHEFGHLVNDEISTSTCSSSVVGLQQTGKQMRGNVSDSIEISLQNAFSCQDDPGMALKTMLTPKGTMAKEPLIGQASKIIPKTDKMASNNVPASTIAPKGPCSSKPERRPRGETCDRIGTIGGSVTGLRRPSTSSERPSTRERRPVTRDASRKPAEIANPCRPLTFERRSATRESAQNANNTTPRRPSTPDRRPIIKDSALKQSNIAVPGRPSADRRAIIKDSAPKLSNIATPRRPSTPDRRVATKVLAPKQSNIGSLHRPSTGERRLTSRDMMANNVSIATSYWPSTDKHSPVTKEGAHKHADVVTLHRPSTAERRPTARDVALKHAPSCRPSTVEKRLVTKGPSTVEKRLVTKGSTLKHENVASLCWPLTPDRHLSKRSETSTPRRPSIGERHPITNYSTQKSEQKTPFRLRAVPNCSKDAMFAAVTPRKSVTPNRLKTSESENISYAKEKVEVHADEKRKSSLSDLPPKKMLTSNVRDDRVLDNFRKPNNEAQAFASNKTTCLQKEISKTKAPISPPPPPPPPPCRPSNIKSRPSTIEKKPNANNMPASGRKPKASTPRWH